MTKKSYVKLSEKHGFKIDHVSDAGNVVCKRLSKKSLKGLKEDGYVVKKIPNGSFVIIIDDDRK